MCTSSFFPFYYVVTPLAFCVVIFFGVLALPVSFQEEEAVAAAATTEVWSAHVH